MKTTLITLLLLTGISFASGSFSVVLEPLALTLEANLEQEITQIGVWTVYAGSGFAIDTTGIRKLQPYTMVCALADAWIAAAEFCTELRAPLVGDGPILRLFVSGVW